MENLFQTPHKQSVLSSQSEPRQKRTPLSQIPNYLAFTPQSSRHQPASPTFDLNILKSPSPPPPVLNLPLPLLIKPSSSHPKDIFKTLSKLRNKSTRSILKNQSQHSHKSVHFSEDVKENCPENRNHSLPTTNNSVTESRLEASEEEKAEFKYEEEVKAGILVQEFDEYPAIVFCKNCKKEIVTTVELEKVKVVGKCSKVVWVLCWCFPSWVYPYCELVHRCSKCKEEIIRVGN